MRHKPVLLILASTYPRWKGDPEPGFVHELAKRMSPGFRTIVLCPHATGAATRERFEGVEVIRYRYAPAAWERLVNDGGIVTNLRNAPWKVVLVPSFVLSQLLVAWRIIRTERVDVVHAHWLIPQGVIAVLLQWFVGRRLPFVVTSHGADLFALRGHFFDAIKRYVIKRADRSTVVSRAMKEALRASNVDVSKVEVQPMGVDLHRRFTIDSSVERSSDELLFVGRLVEKKGLRHLLDSLPRVIQQHPSVRLTIAGFGPEERELRAQAAALGLDEHVVFLGAVAQYDLPDLYRRAALFVAPFVSAASGDQEGLGLVLVEAMGCGCPALAGNVPAARDVLGDWPDLMVDARDSVALSDAIIRLLDDAEGARELGIELARKCVERFDWEQVATTYERLLAEAAGKTGQ